MSNEEWQKLAPFVAIDCEKERWVAVGFAALALIGKPANVQDAFLRQLPPYALFGYPQ